MLGLHRWLRSLMNSRAVLPPKGLMQNVPPDAFIHPTATVIGNVHLGNDVSIWPQAVLRGDVNEIHIGSQSNIQDGVVIHATGNWHGQGTGCPCFIGRGVTIGHSAMLHGCTIHDHVLIGIHATVLDGAVVPSNTVIGAGALVPPKKQLKAGALYLGNPARYARELTSEEIEWIRANAHRYVTLKDRYLNGDLV